MESDYRGKRMKFPGEKGDIYIPKTIYDGISKTANITRIYPVGDSKVVIEYEPEVGGGKGQMELYNIGSAPVKKAREDKDKEKINKLIQENKDLRKTISELKRQLKNKKKIQR